MPDPASPPWFTTLLHTAPDVYFRYARGPAPRLVYVSPAVEALTGYPAEALYQDASPAVCLVEPEDRAALRQMLLSRRRCIRTIHLRRDGMRLPVELHLVPVVRQGALVAVEGVARLVQTTDSLSTEPAGRIDPVQVRLTAIVEEMRALLSAHRPPVAHADPRVLRLGSLTIDPDRMLVREGDTPVDLTGREFLLLRYLAERAGRVITRTQLLQDVWHYRYTGDDRTVDVHVSRLRAKVPALRCCLRAVRHMGYVLDVERLDRAEAG